MKTETKPTLLKKQTLDILDGLAEFSVELTTSPDMQEYIATDLAAFDAAYTHHNVTRETLRARRKARKEARRKLEAFVKNAMQVLKPYFGTRYNLEWQTIAGSTRSVQTPEGTADLIARAEAITSHFTANPARQVAEAKATAAEGTALIAAYRAADTACTIAVGEKRAAALACEAANAKLRQRVRVTWETLATVMGDSDMRWYSFATVRPIDTKLPAVPMALRLVQHGPGTVSITWSKAVRAKRYRLYMQTPTDEAPVAVASARDLIAELKNLPSGTKLVFTVTGVNSAGESRPSESVEITLS